MRYWFDTEFIERGRFEPIKVLSIGIVAEDGREFYAERQAARQMIDDDFAQYGDDWLLKNVAPHLERNEKRRCGVDEMKQRILAFIGDDLTPEFWGYYADYDWIVFCQIFGRMIDLPKGWPMYCRDLKQVLDTFEIRVTKQDSAQEHNALNDARWTRDAWCEALSQR